MNAERPSHQPTNHAPTNRAPAPGASIDPAPAATPNPAPRAGVSNLRFGLAMIVALLADTVGVPFGEVGVVVFDILVGFILALCLRGFRPEIIIACLLEAIPGIGLFPSWSLAVPALWARLKMGAAAAPPRGPTPGAR
jgi:hypothetical protein